MKKKVLVALLLFVTFTSTIISSALAAKGSGTFRKYSFDASSVEDGEFVITPNDVIEKVEDALSDYKSNDAAHCELPHEHTAGIPSSAVGLLPCFCLWLSRPVYHF